MNSSKLTLTLLLLMFYLCNSPKIYAQDKVFDGSITFTTQTQVDEFVAEGYNIVSNEFGSAGVSFNSDPTSTDPITDVSQLNIKHIDGRLSICNLGTITKLNSLRVGSYRNLFISIKASSILEEMSGIEGTNREGDYAIFSVSTALKKVEIPTQTLYDDISISGLNSDVKFTIASNVQVKKFRMNNTKSKTDLDDFHFDAQKLESLRIQSTLLTDLSFLQGQALPVLDRVVVWVNSLLENIDGLKLPSRHMRQILISNNPRLQECCSLAKSRATASSFSIRDNAGECSILSLADYNRLANSCDPTLFSGSADFRSQTDVDEFVAAGYKRILGSVSFNSTSTTDPITDLSQIDWDEVNGNVLITNLGEIEELTSLKLGSYNAIIFVNSTVPSKLKTVRGIQGTNVSGRFSVSKGGIKTIEIPTQSEPIILQLGRDLENIEIDPNTKVKELNVSRLNTSLSILKDINLDYVERLILFNIQDKDLSVFNHKLIEPLTRITINSCPNLESLEGLPNWTDKLTTLQILFNPKLEMCCQLTDRVLDNLIISTLFSNAPSCNRGPQSRFDFSPISAYCLENNSGINLVSTSFSTSEKGSVAFNVSKLTNPVLACIEKLNFETGEFEAFEDFSLTDAEIYNGKILIIPNEEEDEALSLDEKKVAVENLEKGTYRLSILNSVAEQKSLTVNLIGNKFKVLSAVNGGPFTKNYSDNHIFYLPKVPSLYDMNPSNQVTTLSLTNDDKLYLQLNGETGIITGIVSATEGPNLGTKWKVHIVLEKALLLDGHLPKFEFNNQATPTIKDLLTKAWRYYTIKLNNESYLELIDDQAPKTKIVITSEKGKYCLQIGDYANNKNANLGCSDWFDFKIEREGFPTSYSSTHGDINADLECVDEDELIKVLNSDNKQMDARYQLEEGEFSYLMESSESTDKESMSLLTQVIADDLLESSHTEDHIELQKEMAVFNYQLTDEKQLDASFKGLFQMAGNLWHMNIKLEAIKRGKEKIYVGNGTMSLWYNDDVVIQLNEVRLSKSNDRTLNMEYQWLYKLNKGKVLLNLNYQSDNRLKVEANQCSKIEGKYFWKLNNYDAFSPIRFIHKNREVIIPPLDFRQVYSEHAKVEGWIGNAIVSFSNEKEDANISCEDNLQLSAKDIDLDDSLPLPNSPQLQAIKKASIQVYPNPSQGMFTLENMEKKSLVIKVVSLDGQVVFSKSILASEKKSINLQHLKKGIYMLISTSKESSSTQKLIIK
ncbi:T9SS type A sorting domain-containing protein [Sediminitomix flava]|uniref:Putative secreted protein (Por secretion system target) n=1 Tax=Sediminitomix flava TaxID=379075 RepID=A0A315ZGD1_SEDFL|nr:T9SS type A sorting domain-containing protein [Sediminitomix flava]PWJ44199.1 putative secreted protein (Por secretion system target) [Sediminitomix flava]